MGRLMRVPHLATGIAPRPPCMHGPLLMLRMKRSLPATETMRGAWVLLLPLLLMIHPTPRRFLAPPQQPLITTPITRNPRRKRLMLLPKHGVSMNLNPTRNFLLVAVTLTALLPMAAP